MNSLLFVAYTPTECFLVLGTIVLMALLISEILECKSIIIPKMPNLSGTIEETPCKPKQLKEKSQRFTWVTPVYSYNDDCEGPAFWRNTFSNAKGQQQSPINLNLSEAKVIRTNCPLRWSEEYSLPPKSAVLWNEGHTVILHLTWHKKTPILCGGPLVQAYQLDSVRFRWGGNNYEGSEHTVEFTRFALEIQAFHMMMGSKISIEPDPKYLLIVSYLYQVTSADNPYLQEIINNLRLTRNAKTKVCIQPFPICWLLPAFYYGYFLYTGSLTYPPCTEGVKWIVLSEPLGISVSQVREFRKLCFVDGKPLVSNCRPIQKANKRHIHFYVE